MKNAGLPSVILISKSIVSFSAAISTALTLENKYPLFWYKLVKSSPSGLLLSDILFLSKTPLYVSPWNNPRTLESCSLE